MQDKKNTFQFGYPTTEEEKCFVNSIFDNLSEIHGMSGVKVNFSANPLFSHRFASKRILAVYYNIEPDINYKEPPTLPKREDSIKNTHRENSAL